MPTRTPHDQALRGRHQTLPALRSTPQTASAGRALSVHGETLRERQALRERPVPDAWREIARRHGVSHLQTRALQQGPSGGAPGALRGLAAGPRPPEFACRDQPGRCPDRRSARVCALGGCRTGPPRGAHCVQSAPEGQGRQAGHQGSSGARRGRTAPPGRRGGGAGRQRSGAALGRAADDHRAPEEAGRGRGEAAEGSPPDGHRRAGHGVRRGALSIDQATCR